MSKSRNIARFEYKYLLPINEYYAVRNALTPYMFLDNYSKVAPNNRYFVSSIYYDTNDLKAFHEKNDGQFSRIKLRVRTYTPYLDEKALVSVELKTKRGNSMMKYSSLVPSSYYLNLINNNCWPTEKDEVLNEFLRLKLSRSLEPQVIINYYREGFVPRDKSKLRVTFDHEVCSTKSKYLFEENLLFHKHRPKNIILEIKTQSKQPDWLMYIVKKYGLKVITNSKYAQGIDLIYPLMITPHTTTKGFFQNE